jgi:hypothetical protein
VAANDQPSRSNNCFRPGVASCNKLEPARGGLLELTEIDPELLVDISKHPPESVSYISDRRQLRCFRASDLNEERQQPSCNWANIPMEINKVDFAWLLLHK